MTIPISFKAGIEKRGKMSGKQVLWTAIVALGVVIAYNMAVQRGVGRVR